MQEFVNQHRTQPPFTRRNLFLRDSHKCQYCLKYFPPYDLSFDHVLPKKLGGKGTWDNVVTACGRCVRVSQQWCVPHTCTPYPRRRFYVRPASVVQRLPAIVFFLHRFVLFAAFRLVKAATAHMQTVAFVSCILALLLQPWRGGLGAVIAKYTPRVLLHSCQPKICAGLDALVSALYCSPHSLCCSLWSSLKWKDNLAHLMTLRWRRGVPLAPQPSPAKVRHGESIRCYCDGDVHTIANFPEYLARGHVTGWEASRWNKRQVHPCT